MSEQTIEVVKGDVEVKPVTSDLPPTAATGGVSIGEAQFRRIQNSEPIAEEDGPRSLNPYWEISIYNEEEINAIREADKLDPDLAEHYKDLLED